MLTPAMCATASSADRRMRLGSGLDARWRQRVLTRKGSSSAMVAGSGSGGPAAVYRTSGNRSGRVAGVHDPQGAPGHVVVDADLGQQHRRSVGAGGVDAEEVPVPIRGDAGESVRREATGEDAQPVVAAVERELVSGQHGAVANAETTLTPGLFADVVELGPRQLRSRVVRGGVGSLSKPTPAERITSSSLQSAATSSSL